MSGPPAETAESEPPLSRFLLSFIVAPGAIVLVCLSIIVGIRWLTHPGTSPEQLVDTIERREGNVRWRAAVHLAGMLADPEHGDLRQDRQIAGRLTQILRRELQSGGGRKEDVTLRIFLCRALGEFKLDVAIPALVDATGSQRDRDVRRSALEAIALLADTLSTERVGAEPGLIDSLLAASRDGDPQVRLSAAYAMGVLGGSESEERLAAMLLDEHALVRYNAATGLARWGNAATIDVLLEMLVPDQRAVFGNAASDAQQGLIHVNALEALTQLMSANPAVSGERFREAVDGLEKTNLTPAARTKVKSVRELIEGRIRR